MRGARMLRAIVLVAGAVIAILSGARGAAGLRPIVLSGEAVPGQAGLTFAGMTSSVAIAPDGSIAFEATVNAAGFPKGVFGYDATTNALRMAALDQTVAPVNDPPIGATSYNGIHDAPAAANGGR